MSQLALLIEGNREELVARFVARLYQTSASETLAPEEVADSIRDFLADVSRSLRAPSAGALRNVEAVDGTASEHGSQRFKLGYDLGTLVREYATLHDVVWEFLDENERLAEISTSDVRALGRCLIYAASAAAACYAHQRDEQVREQASQHLGFLAHELRTPLGTARLAAEQIARGQVSDSKWIPTLQRAIQRLSHLIDDALIEVRLKSAARARPQPLSLPALIAEVVEDSVSVAEDKAQHIEVSLEEVPMVVADPKLLYSCLSNLLRNAIKFSRREAVIKLRARSAEGRVRIEVEDECGGLAEETHKKLFDPFVQVGADRSGFGLGLAIAKQAVDAHAGELRVHNAPGRGCVFVLELPVPVEAPR